MGRKARSRGRGAFTAHTFLKLPLFAEMPVAPRLQSGFCSGLPGIME
jgi:hypothetical protein